MPGKGFKFHLKHALYQEKQSILNELKRSAACFDSGVRAWFL